MPRPAILPCLALVVACSCSADPTPSGAAPGGPGFAAASKEPGGDWRRGTVTIGPDGTHAVHAEDDSVTVCAPELAPELRQEGLALRFRGELIPPAANERRWCTLARDLQIQRAE